MQHNVIPVGVVKRREQYIRKRNNLTTIVSTMHYKLHITYINILLEGNVRDLAKRAEKTTPRKRYNEVSKSVGKLLEEF